MLRGGQPASVVVDVDGAATLEGCVSLVRGRVLRSGRSELYRREYTVTHA